MDSIITFNKKQQINILIKEIIKEIIKYTENTY